MKKKNGFTVVELIVSFSLTMIVVLFLFQTIILLKDMYINNGIKSTLLNKQAIMNEKLYHDFRNKGIRVAANCGENCLTFIFEDNSRSVLRIDKENNLFHYGDYTTKLTEGSSFGELSAFTKTTPGVSAYKNDSFIQIQIPITNSVVDGDFGVNAIYQYNSRITSISDVSLNGEGNLLYLKGSSEMKITSGTVFQDPGYYVVDSSGNILEYDSRVQTSGVVGSDPGEYLLTYRLIVNGVAVDTKIRKVIVVTS